MHCTVGAQNSFSSEEIESKRRGRKWKPRPEKCCRQKQNKDCTFVLVHHWSLMNPNISCSINFYSFCFCYINPISQLCFFCCRNKRAQAAYSYSLHVYNLQDPAALIESLWMQILTRTWVNENRKFP